MKTTAYDQRLGVLDSNVNNLCPFCREEVESLNHILLYCPLVWRLWSKILDWWNLSWVTPGSIGGLLEWWSGMRFNRFERRLWQSIPFTLMWYVWKSRNEYVFQGVHLDFKGLGEIIKIRSAFWLKYGTASVPYSVQDVVFNLQQL